MAQIWLDESKKVNENKLTFFGNKRNKNIYDTIQTIGTRGESLDTRSISKDEINNLLNAIKEKDFQLNKIVNQLKKMSSKNQSYDLKNMSSTSKVTLPGKSDKYPKTTDNYESKIRQLLSIIKEKDDKVNSLINQLHPQMRDSETTNIYELGNRTFDEKDQRIGQTRTYSTRGKDDKLNKSVNSKLRTQSYIKNTYDSNKTFEEFDTINTQNTMDNNLNNRYSNQFKTISKTKKIEFGSETDAPGDYEHRISELETIIKEKDDELEKLVNQLNTQTDKVKKSLFTDLDLDCYGLGILTEKESWNDVIKVCPINNLYICDKKDWNESNEISQLDLSIINLGKNWDDIVEEGRDALYVEGLEKDPLEHQKINLLQINGHPILEKWLDEIQPNKEVEKLEIKKTKIDENVVEQNVGITICSLEKEDNIIQNINYIYVGGKKRPWEDLSEDKITFTFEKIEKPENEIETRDSIEIMAFEKEPLVRQLIDALYVAGFEKAENECQLVQEMEITKISKPDNVLEQKDSLEIRGLEKDELAIQEINQLFIAGSIKPENKYQRTQEMEIYKTPKPENEIEANLSIEIIGLQKEPLSRQLINQLIIEGLIKPENEEQRIEELEILKMSRPENSIEEKDSINIKGLEKEPLSRQLINMLFIAGSDKPENEEQRTEELELLKKPKLENIIEEIDSINIKGLEKELLSRQLINMLFIAGFDKPENEEQRAEELELLKT